MPYESRIYPGEFVIDDSFVPDPHPVVGGEPMSYGLMPRNGRCSPSVAKPFDLPLISRSEWQDRIKEKDDLKANLSDIAKYAGVRCKNQNGTNYCWYNATLSGLEVARVVQGQHHVELSPASGAAIIKRYQNVGGWGMEALEHMANDGACPVSLWPANAIDRRYDTAESKAARKSFRVLEWYELARNPREAFEQEVTLLLLGIPVSVGHNWWGHQVLHMDLVMQNGVYLIRFMNSHGESYGDRGYSLMTEAKARPDDVAVAPRVIAFVGDDGQEYQCETYRQAA